MSWTSLVFGHFRFIFEEKMDPKYPWGHFFPNRIPSKKFKLKIPIFSQSDGDATQWPNSSKQNLTWGQLRNAHKYQKHVQLVGKFFKEFITFSSQQCSMMRSVVKTVAEVRLRKTWRFIDLPNVITDMAWIDPEKLTSCQASSDAGLGNWKEKKNDQLYGLI